jgi:predicted phage terminase large subunit-like protein
MNAAPTIRSASTIARQRDVLRELLRRGDGEAPFDLEDLRREEGRAQAAARSSLLSFCCYTHAPPFKVGWWNTALCATLDGMIDRIGHPDAPRQIVIAPPRHGKSEISAVRAPVYAMGKRPGLRVLMATYGQSLSLVHSRKARDLARSQPVQAVFGQVSASLDQAGEWSAWGGSYTATSAGGGNGLGADMIVLDDMHKGPEDAYSETQRERRWAWIMAVVETRLQAGGIVLLDGTSWHEDDVLHRAEKQGDWHVFRCAAVAEQDEEHRAAGDALHPALVPAERLARLRRVLPSHMWSALYQGRPTAAGAEYINPAWLKTWTAPPSTATADEVWFTVDASQGVGKDQTAIQVWARHDRTWSLIERIGGQDLTIPRLVEALVLLWTRYGADVLRAPGGVLIENTSNGAAILQTGISAVIDGDEVSIPAICLVPFVPASVPGADKGKGARAVYLRLAAESGAIAVPAFAEWRDLVLTQWRGFPRAEFDDDVDAASMLFVHLLTRGEAGASIDDWLSAMGSIQ